MSVPLARLSFSGPSAFRACDRARGSLGLGRAPGDPFGGWLHSESAGQSLCALLLSGCPSAFRFGLGTVTLHGWPHYLARRLTVRLLSCSRWPEGRSSWCAVFQAHRRAVRIRPDDEAVESWTGVIGWPGVDGIQRCREKPRPGMRINRNRIRTDRIDLAILGGWARLRWHPSPAGLPGPLSCESAGPLARRIQPCRAYWPAHRPERKWDPVRGAE